MLSISCDFSFRFSKANACRLFLPLVTFPDDGGEPGSVLILTWSERKILRILKPIFSGMPSWLKSNALNIQSAKFIILITSEIPWRRPPPRPNTSAKCGCIQRQREQMLVLSLEFNWLLSFRFLRVSYFRTIGGTALTAECRTGQKERSHLKNPWLR